MLYIVKEGNNVFTRHRNQLRKRIDNRTVVQDFDVEYAENKYDNQQETLQKTIRLHPRRYTRSEEK